MIDFFVEDLKFDKEDILYFTELQVLRLVKLLDQSKIFKQFPVDLEPGLRKLAERVFIRNPNQSNCQQLLNIMINESTSEVVKDFVVNRNPEFAIQVVHHSIENDGVIADVRAKEVYLHRLREELKTVNLIKFQNLNRFFYNDPSTYMFCARDRKQFKPGSGQFDIIYDVDEKINQTVKAKFNYLEKQPLRKFLTCQHVLGCAVNDQASEVLIVELDDINKDLCLDEIKARTHVDPEQEKKKLFAYVIDPAWSQEEVEKIRDKARKRAVDIKYLVAKDFVVELKKLYVDSIRKEMFFQVVCDEMHTVTIAKVDFTFSAEPNIVIGYKQAVTKKVQRGQDEDNKGGKPQQKGPTELELSYWEDENLRKRRFVYRLKQEKAMGQEKTKAQLEEEE